MRHVLCGASHRAQAPLLTCTHARSHFMSTFRDLLGYLRTYRRYIGRRMYLVFVLTIATAFAQGFGITMLLPLLRASETTDGATEDMGTAEQLLYDMLSWIGIADSMIGILVFIALIFVGKGLLKFAEGAYVGYLQSRLLRELKTKLFDGYNRMDYKYYIKQSTGHFVNVINGQVNQLFTSFHSFKQFLSHLVTSFSYLGFAFLIAWKFALMALGIGLVILFLFKYLNEYVRRLSRKRSKEMSELNKLLMQSLQSLKYIISTNQSSHLRRGVKNSVYRLTNYIFKQKIAGSFTGAIKEPVSVLLIIGLIIVQVAVFKDPIAPIFVALLLFHRGMQSMIAIQSSLQSVMNSAGAVEMVDDEVKTLKENREPNGKTKLSDLQKQIEFDDATFAYGDDEKALENINLRIKANTTVALVGESGAGKSTLVDMITLLLKPQQGTVRIDGTPGSKIDLTSWRSQIGYVSQETVVFDDTIANNISLWKGDYESDPELREQVQHAAKEAYAHNFIKDLPNGYETMVGDRGVRLSGGQRQRLFVARELFKRPNLLILDEATSALDTESERYIQDSIDALKGEMTVVIIAHRLSTIKNVDYVYVMDEGKVIEEGPYTDLRNHDGSRFQEMVEMQRL
jgi:subfamily B ATP-binding cassette protein MsbA